jgi:hypothetical protein
MIILLAKDGKYSMGNDFPIFTIPLEMEGATSQSLEDFQWWAYSSDFKKWLEKNPRQWVADSEDMTQYGDISQILRESKGGSGYSLNKAIREINEYLENEENRVSNFSDFHSSAVFEDESTQANVKAGEEKAVKLAFSYNKLLSEGKLETEYSVASQDPGKDKAVFLCLEDAETGENLLQTLDAYKISPMEIDNPNAKFRLFEIKDRIISGPIPDNATGPSIAQEALNKGVQYGVYAVAAGGIFAGVKLLGQGIALRRAYKGLKMLRTGKDAVKSTKGLRMLVKTKNGIKSLWGAVNPMKAIAFWGNVVKSGVRGAKLIKTVGNLKNAGIVAKSVGMIKGFATGAKVAFSGAKAAEVTNPIGWALLAINAVGSTWNWYSGNQAPRLGQVEDFAKDKFDPKAIKIGVPITVCWSQPAGGWGVAVSFLWSNETRTTMELIKIADKGGKSIFLLTQINSKEVQKQIAEYDITLLAFDNSDVVETGWIDNEDLDFDMFCTKQDLNSLFNYQGSCDWNLFQNEFNNAQSTLLISDPDAPDEYEFHFSDSEDNIINVVGTKVSTDELSKYSEEELGEMFGVTISKETQSKIKAGIQEEPKETEEEPEPETAEVSDSLNYGLFPSISESQVITRFSDFKKAAYQIHESGEEATTVKGNSEEGADDADSKSVDTPALTPQQMSEPAKVAIYLVTERDYADPKLRGKYETGEFKNFLLDSKDWEARNGSPIEVDPNTDEVLEDAVRGLYTYVEKKEDDKPIVKDEVQDADDSDKEDNEEKERVEAKKDDYYITVSPEDVEIKDKKSSTVIRDMSMGGGVNLYDTLLTPTEKEALKIENWKTVTFAKELRDNKGDIIEVKFKNKYAPFGDKSRKYRATDGEAFEIAKRFVEQTKDRIKYE